MIGRALMRQRRLTIPCYLISRILSIPPREREGGAEAASPQKSTEPRKKNMYRAGPSYWIEKTPHTMQSRMLVACVYLYCEAAAAAAAASAEAVDVSFQGRIETIQFRVEIVQVAKAD